ncbi:MAG: DUF7287 family protein [Halodesulfurarchaeum sp.]
MERRGATVTRSDRGQTPQDFAVGISIFLITVTFVFAFVPSVLQPSQAGAEATLTTEADRVASSIVSNLSAPGRPNHLDESRVEEFVDAYDDGNTSRFRTDYGLSTYTQVNVTIRTSNGSGTVDDPSGDPYRFGDEYRNQEGVVVQRVVTMDTPGCDDGCHLIVRVW